MPVSALRFEPRVDLQSRNFAEGQADVTIRGGIFENTGFRIGAVSLFDPQTGHYFAEIPIAPAMLSAPQILTGAELALATINATAGAVAYTWRPIRTAGVASLGFGEYRLLQAELYQGCVSSLAVGRWAADVALAHSESDGSIRNGDHNISRVNARLQLGLRQCQTDLFFGYQDKVFGWPNLYTPFNSNESEDIRTLLLLLNHRSNLSGGDYFEVGAYYRRNEDNYAFNRFAPVGPVPPFQHTTWVRGAATEARITSEDTTFNVRAEVLADDLASTSLTFGRFHRRLITKLALAPERTWGSADGSVLRIRAGATYDDTSRTGGTVSPMVQISRSTTGPNPHRIYAEYSEASQVPTYTALNSNQNAGLFRGNPNLSRQISRNAELGISGDLMGWTTQAALFIRTDRNLVDWTFRKGVTARSANAVTMETAGVELVAHRSWKMADVIVGYTGLAKNPDYKGALVDASFYALNYARHRLTLAIVARLTGALDFRMDNEVRFQASNLLRTTGGDEAVISALGLTYHPASWRRVRLTVQADNLWNSDYQQVPAVPAARRQVSVVAGYSW
ncbi:MAG: TonB-dependent receptor [Opitutus sp.]